MENYRLERSPNGKYQVRVSLRGTALLTHPMYNKSTAFTKEERRVFGLLGRLPSAVATMDRQARRAYENIMRKTDPLERYIGLAALHDRNEHLFYRVLSEHVEELLPIVYTPTVGEGCRQFSHIFRRTRGLWITPDDRGRIDEVLGGAPYEDVRLIVVTDNERILGLGDQGAGGMGIPVGKLALYTLAAGIHPSQTLPVSLDVGTDNESLLDDPLYVGFRERRLRGEPYRTLVEEFVQAVGRRFPKALLQWEDFKKQNAFDLLDRYRKRLLSFNDDIQGTAAVAHSGVLAACRATGVPLAKQRFVLLGAGAAGIGIARQLRSALQRAGLRGDDLSRAIVLLDSQGLLIEGRDVKDPCKKDFLWPVRLVEQSGLPLRGPHDLEMVVRATRPTTLIGTSGTPGCFTEAVVRAMASAVERPTIFPFSNPTSLSEARPADLIAWTDGKALVATGSPFDPVVHAGRTIRIGQGNNVFIFPGVGLGALVAGAREVTDSMFIVAAETLAAEVASADLESGALFPRLARLREITRKIAIVVARDARDTGIGADATDEEITQRVQDSMWVPEYPELIPI